MRGDWIVPPREHRLITSDSQVIYVESAGEPINYQGEIQHFGIFRDITERKQARKLCERAKNGTAKSLSPRQMQSWCDPVNSLFTRILLR